VALAATRRPLDVAAPDAIEVRRTLRTQIARLDAQLAAYAFDGGLAPAAPAGAAPRLLRVDDLERHRDALAGRLSDVQTRAAARAEREDAARLRLEAMLAAPERHRFARVTRAELGLSGCGAYAVRPRLGLIGMLAGWWEVKLSSGCP
jgi:hypothetical protein